MRWLDHLYLALFPRSPSFLDGWGDAHQLEMALDGRWSQIKARPGQIRWQRTQSRRGVTVRDGLFESPERGLPDESRVAKVRLVEPIGPSRGLAVALPSWGDDAWATRERVYGRAIRRGISVLMLENPLYGSRRREGQEGTGLRTVSDFVLMGRAIMREALALLGWARDAGYAQVGLAGYSMGGQMAALTAAISPEPVRIAMIAPSASPNTVFVDGPLRADVAWDRLGPGAADRLRELMGALSVLALPPPRDAERAVLVGTRSDAFVLPGDVGAIARHWGAEPRWLNDGHVSVITLRARAVGQALIDAFA